MKFKTHEKTIFYIAILILLCINLLPILTVTAGPPPDKGKLGKGKPDRKITEISFDGDDVIGTVPKAYSDFVNGLFTHTRANAWGGHVPYYDPIEFGAKFEAYGNFESFVGPHVGTDLVMILDWNRDGKGGSIIFCLWFDCGELDEDSSDNYKLLDEEGTFTYLGNNKYEVVLENAEILGRLGANTKGKDKYETLWGPKEVTFTFTLSIFT